MIDNFICINFNENSMGTLVRTQLIINHVFIINISSPLSAEPDLQKAHDKARELSMYRPRYYFLTKSANQAQI